MGQEEDLFGSGEEAISIVNNEDMDISGEGASHIANSNYTHGPDLDNSKTSPTLFPMETSSDTEFSGIKDEQFLQFTTPTPVKRNTGITFSSKSDGSGKYTTEGLVGSTECLDIERKDLGGIRVTLKYGVQTRTRKCYKCQKDCDNDFINECNGRRIDIKQCLCIVHD